MTTDPALLAALEAWFVQGNPTDSVYDAFEAGWRARERHREAMSEPVTPNITVHPASETLVFSNSQTWGLTQKANTLPLDQVSEEDVARAICDATGDYTVKDYHRRYARAAIAAVLAAIAKVGG